MKQVNPILNLVVSEIQHISTECYGTLRQSFTIPFRRGWAELFSREEFVVRVKSLTSNSLRLIITNVTPFVNTISFMKDVQIFSSF